MTCKMILNSADTDFSDRFVALQSMKREQDADVQTRKQQIATSRAAGPPDHIPPSPLRF